MSTLELSQPVAERLAAAAAERGLTVDELAVETIAARFGDSADSTDAETHPLAAFMRRVEPRSNGRAPSSAIENLQWVSKNQRQAFAGQPTVDGVISFLLGYDTATGYSLLSGFHGWLVAMSGAGRNIFWTGHVEAYCYDVEFGTVISDGPREDDERIACDRIFELVIGFLEGEPSTKYSRTTSGPKS